jgi:hypothetical protein
MTALLPPLCRPTRAALGLAAGLVLGGCGHDENVLLGVEEQAREAAPTTRDEVWGRAPLGEPRPATPAAQAAAYEKPEGVWVDVRWFGGRRYDDVEDLLVQQLGPLAERKVLDERAGEELRFQNGEVRVVRGVVYMLRVRLPEPLTRTDALLALGFTTQADHWRETHREYRLAHAFDFVRFRMQRDAVRRDRVVVVEAWKTDAGEVR